VWDAKTGVGGLILKGHTAGVVSAAFSPDGTRIVTGSNDNTARVWNAESGAEVLRLKGHSEGVTSATFSLDGTRIVTASSDNTVRVWDAKSGVLLLSIQHRSVIQSIAWSPDGAKLLVGLADGTIEIRDGGPAPPITASTTPEEKDDFKKLIGKWELDNAAEGKPTFWSGRTLEFTERGKVFLWLGKIKMWSGKMEKMEGTYKFDGKTIDVVFSLMGQELFKETLTITKLTDAVLLARNSKDEEHKFTRVKKTFRPPVMGAGSNQKPSS
jgi:uncharacterized protein (TIGR03066 family)